MFLPLVSCNLLKSQNPSGIPTPLAPGASAKWNNKGRMDAADNAASSTKDARDFKRVHFNLETLNTRRLLARIATSDAKVGRANSEHLAEPMVQNRRLCENGGPVSFASLVLSLPSASSSSSYSAQLNTAAPPSVALAPPSAIVDPPQPSELHKLQQEIEQMREKLRIALARRAEIQTTLAKPVTMVTYNPSQVPTTAPTTIEAPAIITPLMPLPANTKCVMTMTDPPHKVLSKVQPLHSRLANQRRWWWQFRLHDPLHTTAILLCTAAWKRQDFLYYSSNSQSTQEVMQEIIFNVTTRSWHQSDLD